MLRPAQLLQAQMQASFRLASRDGRIIWLENHGAIPTIRFTNHIPPARAASRLGSWDYCP